MSWKIVYMEDALRDLQNLDNAQRILVLKSIRKVSSNPVPQSEGGYGKPLGNIAGKNLTGLLKIKLRNAGLRVVYCLERRNGVMCIIVISVRDDDKVYQIANHRIKSKL